VDATTLRNNVERVLERIAAAERRAGRPGQVALVAVSKTHPAEMVAEAYCAGLRVFGENRVEEAKPKAEAVRALLAAKFSPEVSIEWHMVGHLQSRKAADVFPWASLVHSVDTVKLAGRLSRAIPEGQTLPALLEVNVSGEESKAGFRPEELPSAIGAMAGLPSLRLEGLMTMAPIVEDPEQARPVFRALRHLREQLARQYPGLPWTHLSMGMTDDFEVAIEEGATLVRIGRAIFGER
jgi:pyridoxal phosphate enzyme (YggS family)